MTNLHDSVSWIIDSKKPIPNCCCFFLMSSIDLCHFHILDLPSFAPFFPLEKWEGRGKHCKTRVTKIHIFFYVVVTYHYWLSEIYSYHHIVDVVVIWSIGSLTVIIIVFLPLRRSFSQNYNNQTDFHKYKMVEIATVQILEYWICPARKMSRNANFGA